MFVLVGFSINRNSILIYWYSLSLYYTLQSINNEWNNRQWNNRSIRDHRATVCEQKQVAVSLKSYRRIFSSDSVCVVTVNYSTGMKR